MKINYYSVFRSLSAQINFHFIKNYYGLPKNMITSVKDIVKKKMTEMGLDCRPRSADLGLWNSVYDNLDYQPIAYGSDMIDYQTAYIQSCGGDLEDLSVIIYSGGLSVGLWLLHCSNQDASIQFSSSGSDIYSPVFRSDLPRNLAKKLTVQLLDCLCQLITEGIGSKITIQDSAVATLDKKHIGDWSLHGLSLGGEPKVRFDLIVDLSYSIDEIRSRYRKSYKPFINKGLREWDYEILDQSNMDITVWDEFRVFHKTTAGRVTRSTNTWDIQLEMIMSGVAFLIVLRDPGSSNMVGAALFQCSRDEGLYSVAAYDRALFKKPLGHVVQQLAIGELRRRGVRFYFLGERVYSKLTPIPTKKEMDISNFKEGFSTSILPCNHITLDRS